MISFAVCKVLMGKHNCKPSEGWTWNDRLNWQKKSSAQYRIWVHSPCPDDRWSRSIHANPALAIGPGHRMDWESHGRVGLNSNGPCFAVNKPPLDPSIDNMYNNIPYNASTSQSLFSHWSRALTPYLLKQLFRRILMVGKTDYCGVSPWKVPKPDLEKPFSGSCNIIPSIPCVIVLLINHQLGLVVIDITLSIETQMQAID